MRDGMAETIAEAEAQTFELLEFSNWRRFSVLLDGYKIAAEMGFELGEWGARQEKIYNETGTWDLSPLELRVMIFYQFRVDYWTGYDYTECDECVDSLLRALSQKLNLPYQPKGDKGQ